MVKKCDDIKDLISLYIDNDLDEKERMELEDHIKECSSCNKSLEELKHTVNLCKYIQDEEIPSSFQASLNQKLSDARPSAFSLVRNKGILKICSTIAAVFVIALFTKMFLDVGIKSGLPYSPNSQNQKNKIADGDKASSEIKSEVQGKVSTEDSADKLNSNASSANKAPDAKQAFNQGNKEGNGVLDDNSLHEFKNKAIPSPTSRSLGTASPRAKAAKEEQNTEEQNQEQKIAALASGTGDVYSDTTGTAYIKESIVVSVNDVKVGLEKIKSIAESSKALLDEDVSDPDAQKSLEVSNLEDEKIVLKYKIQNLKYKDFLDCVKNTFGASNIEITDADKPQNIIAIEKSIKELNENIKELEASHDERARERELKVLKDEVQRLNGELEALREKDEQYSIIIITIIKK